MFTIDLQQLVNRSGIPWHVLHYDVIQKRLPAAMVGKTYHIPLDVAEKIVKDPRGYLAWRTETTRRQRKVVYNGEVYPSVSALARTLNIRRTDVYPMIKRGEVVYVPRESVFR